MYFSIICLQESWLTKEADLTMFHISDYSCSAKCKYISQHGGLLTYVHNCYTYEDIIISIQSNIWEGQFLKLHSNDNGKNLFVSNIYRPPNTLTNELLKTFMKELGTIILDLNRPNSIVILLGDFNINLWKIDDTLAIKDYSNDILSLWLFPTITLPTRIANNSATLINNLFANYSADEHSSGILITNLSDH